jgi:hypothetical protein
VIRPRPLPVRRRPRPPRAADRTPLALSGSARSARLSKGGSISFFVASSAGAHAGLAGGGALDQVGEPDARRDQAVVLEPVAVRKDAGIA